jgi:hypothetical protein
MDLELDPRFDSSFVQIAMRGDPVLALPMYAPQVSDWPDPNYDVPTLLGLADGTSATEFCLLGGRTDLRCTALLAHGADPRQLDDAATLAVGIARDTAARSRRYCAMLYVDADDVLLHRAATSVGVAGSAILGERYVIPDVGASIHGYLSRLGASRHGIVRHDLRKLGGIGLRADVCDWSAVLDEAAPLIAKVKAQHCQADLPALIHYRLSRRALDPDVQCVAFITAAGRPSNRGDNGMGLCATSR